MRARFDGGGPSKLSKFFFTNLLRFFEELVATADSNCDFFFSFFFLFFLCDVASGVCDVALGVVAAISSSLLRLLRRNSSVSFCLKKNEWNHRFIDEDIRLSNRDIMEHQNCLFDKCCPALHLEYCAYQPLLQWGSE